MESRAKRVWTLRRPGQVRRVSERERPPRKLRQSAEDFPQGRCPARGPSRSEGAECPNVESPCPALQGVNDTRRKDRRHAERGRPAEVEAFALLGPKRPPRPVGREAHLAHLNEAHGARRQIAVGHREAPNALHEALGFQLRCQRRPRPASSRRIASGISKPGWARSRSGGASLGS